MSPAGSAATPTHHRRFLDGPRRPRIHKGEIAEPVGEMNVSGNLLQLFARLDAIGGHTWRYNMVHTPSLVFDRVGFSGAGG